VSNVQLVRDAYECFGRGHTHPPPDDGPQYAVERSGGDPYQPSGKPWHGPDAVLQNMFVKIGADFDGTFVVHPRTSTMQATRSSSKGASRGPSRPQARLWTTQVCHVFKVRDGAEPESCKLTRSRQGAPETRAGGAQKRLQAGEVGQCQRTCRRMFGTVRPVTCRFS
jgi:uncharacterized protein